MSAYHRDDGFQDAGTPGAAGASNIVDGNGRTCLFGHFLSSDTLRLSFFLFISRNVPDRDVSGLLGCQNPSLYAPRRLDRRDKMSKGVDVRQR